MQSGIDFECDKNSFFFSCFYRITSIPLTLSSRSVFSNLTFVVGHRNALRSRSSIVSPSKMDRAAERAHLTHANVSTRIKCPRKAAFVKKAPFSQKNSENVSVKSITFFFCMITCSLNFHVKAVRLTVRIETLQWRVFGGGGDQFLMTILGTAIKEF